MPDSYDYSQPRPREANATAQFPLITYALIALCVIVTTAFLTSESMPGTLWFKIGHFGAPDNDAIWYGHYLPLFFSVFVHGSIIHILFNVLWLRQLGAILESTLHPVTYLVFFIAAAVIGSGAQLALTGGMGIGASGVVYAMFGLMWAGRGKYPQWRAVATNENLRTFVIWGVFCIAATWAHYLNIANGAHAGGFVFGLAIGWLFFAPRRRLIWSLPLVALIAITVLSVTWMPWQGTWDFWKAGTEFDRKHYHNAISWYHRSLKLGTDPKTNWHNIGSAWNNIGVDDALRGDSAGFNEAIAQKAFAQRQADSL